MHLIDGDHRVHRIEVTYREKNEATLLPICIDQRRPECTIRKLLLPLKISCRDLTELQSQFTLLPFAYKVKLIK